MKRTVALIAGALALALVGYFGSQLPAQQGAAPTTTRPAEPRTRIALLNQAYVIKNYKKWETFQAELKTHSQGFELRLKAKQTESENHVKQAQDTKLSQEQREAAAKEITRLKREMEDINNEAKAFLGKKLGEQMVIVYRDIQEAAQRYAVAHNYDMVLNYTDATTMADYYGERNIADKLQTRACMPLYAAPGLDISQEVVMALNANYSRTASPAASTGGTPRPSGN